MPPLDSSAETVLQHTDLVVTYYSLTALEAIARRIPVAMVNLTGKRDLFPELTEILGAESIRCFDDFDAIIQRLDRGEGPKGPSTEQLGLFCDRALRGNRDMDHVLDWIRQHVQS
jgi:hypothetical protein